MALAGVPQTLRCYRLELEHFGNAGRWGPALRLLAELKEAGLTPDAKVREAGLVGWRQDVGSNVFLFRRLVKFWAVLVKVV